jgi:polyhydroxybutyrate depolymerase
MNTRVFQRLKISEVLVLTSMVVIGAIILLHDVLNPIPGVSAGPVPTMTGRDCHQVEAPGSRIRGFTVEGPDGLLVRVRVPANYDARRAYPLLVVYPPAGFDRFAAERYYGVTEKATQRGWIVAFSDARPLSMHTTRVQAHVADVVARSFCIAHDHIAYFGHSDGGALAEGILSLVPPLSRPRAIFASAAGITRGDLETYGCIARVSVMIAHNRLDDRFPDFGRGAASYWAACGGCRALDAAEVPTDTCQRFSDCADDLKVTFCEVSTPHKTFPPIVLQALEFLESATFSSESTPR